MRISDLKKEINQAKKEEIETALLVLYQSLTKKEKEKFDSVFLSSLRHEQTTAIDFETLSCSVKQFCSLALNGEYKLSDSKKLHEVDRYLDDLSQIPSSDPNYSKSIEVYFQLIITLSYGVRYPLFANGNPFITLKKDQLDLFDQGIERLLFQGPIKINLARLLDWYEAIPILPYDHGVFSFAQCIVQHLKTMPAKERMLTLVKETMAACKEQEPVERLALLGLLLYDSLQEIEEGTIFYVSHIPSSDQIHQTLLELYKREKKAAWTLLLDQAVKRTNYEPTESEQNARSHS